MQENAPSEFSETTDHGLIADYIALRRRVFRLHYPWLPEDFGHEDETDRLSHIVVARRDRTVYGGARLTISTPVCPRKMPLEEAGFDIRSAELFTLGDFDPHQASYGEIGRMAVDPLCARGLEMSCGLARELCRVAARLGLESILSICPESAVRLNRRNASGCGVGFRRMVEVPTVFGVAMWLCLFTGIQQAYESRETRGLS